MGSRAFLLLGLLSAILLLISSEVVARDLAETSTEKQNAAKASTGTNGVDEAKHEDNGRYEPQCIFPTYPPPPPPCDLPKSPPPCGCGGNTPGGMGGFVPPGASGPSSSPGGGNGGVPGIG